MTSFIGFFTENFWSSLQAKKKLLTVQTLMNYNLTLWFLIQTKKQIISCPTYPADAVITKERKTAKCNFDAMTMLHEILKPSRLF